MRIMSIYGDALLKKHNFKRCRRKYGECVYKFVEEVYKWDYTLWWWSTEKQWVVDTVELIWL